jgi:hypothetical protein
MKTIKTNKLSFTKINVVELNKEEALKIVGGTSINENVTGTGSVFTSKLCQQV